MVRESRGFHRAQQALQIAGMIRVALLFVCLLAIAARGQMPPVGTIDVFGVRRVSARTVLDSLRLREGDSLPASRREVEQRLEKIPGVEKATLSAVCCNEGRTALFVGIVEEGATPPKFGLPPQRAVRLPEPVLATARQLQDAVQAAVRSGNAEEDRTQGHSLLRDSTARAIQERYLEYAARYRERLEAVLRASSDPEHRAIAAEVLGYAPDKREVVEDLHNAMGDPDERVRNNAMRALALIAGYALRNPSSGITVPYQQFVTLLYSPVWTDRNKASLALAELTQSRDPALLRLLRTRALGPLVEMARWRSKGHAMPALLILGRIGGMSDDAIVAAWQRGNPQPIIDAATRPRG